MVGIPLRNDLPYFDLQIPLDGVTYTLEVEWNTRAANGVGQWFMNVRDEQGINILQAGLALVCGAAISFRTADRSPPGIFLVLDTTGKGIDPGIGDLGVRCKLLYASKADLAQLGLT